MAKTKQELQTELTERGIEFDAKAKVADLAALLQETATETPEAAADTSTEEDVATEAPEAETVEEATAKAGKRSNKALREAAEKDEKESRKASGETTATTPKQPVKPTRSRLERRGKQFRKSAEQIEKDKSYSLEEAVALAQKTSHVKFDATIELHVRLGVDPRQADQNIRDNLVLPAGTGKQVRIAVLTDDTAAATKAGAALAGTDEVFAKLDKGELDFDVLIATPALMSKLGKYARQLGPRGLMPNPKSGTVTNDIDRAVAEAKAGRVEYRVDSTGIVHLGVGKASFTPTQLLENVQAILTSLKANKPSSLKGTYFKSIHLASTMGPSITVSLNVIS